MTSKYTHEGFTFVPLNQGLPTECLLDLSIIPGISVNAEFRDFSGMRFIHEGENVDHKDIEHNITVIGQLKTYFEQIFNALAADTANNFFSARISAGVEGVYLTNDNRLLEIGKSSGEQLIYRHEAKREEVIANMINILFNPETFLEGADVPGSALIHPVSLRAVTLSITIPMQYNANALGTSMRLIASEKFNQYVSYLPYNKDKYCVLHCIRKFQVNAFDKARKIVTDDEEYEADFEAWKTQHQLDDFYRGDMFLIDKVPELESRLGLALNIYRFDPDSRDLELYYRSDYKHSINPLNIAIIPMSQFYNVRSKAAPAEFIDPIAPADETLIDREFFSSVNVKQLFCTVQGHAVVFSPTYFAGRGRGIADVCRYCHKTTRSTKHEEMCLQYHQGVNAADRTREYKEVKNPNLTFTKWHSVYKTPFVTYDWETRIVIDQVTNAQVHTAYSYCLFYFNIFEPEKSKIIMRTTDDGLTVQQLQEAFVEDCKTLTIHHHDEIQSVEFAEKIPKRESDNCGFCGVEYGEKNRPEYNHSHFLKDDLNLEYNMYICNVCNSRCQLRNKPLKFFAHNGSRYDQNLFLPTFFNNSEVKTTKFLNKNESRFSQVEIGFSKGRGDMEYPKFGPPRCRYSLSFNDSMLLCAGSLASNCEAWIDKTRDHGLLSTLMKIFYPDAVDINALVNQSFKKQVFAYTALNNVELTKQTEPLAKEYFVDTFINKECSVGDYKEYLAADNVLRAATGYGAACTFGDFHDYYLLLDAILLGILLHSFMNTAHALTGLNPLAFLSTSSYTFNSFLKHNMETEQEQIVIPKVDVQKFLQRSIHGGFTHVFNKTNLKGPQDYTFYVDFTSLYPTIKSQVSLPREFLQWLDFASVEDALTKMRKNSRLFYYFVECDIAPLAVEHQERAAMYAMFPGKCTINREDYSQDQQERWKINSGNSHFPETHTLNTVTFYEKRNYTCSWAYLDAAIAAGYEVTEVHKVAVFLKAPVMKDYIDKIYQLKKEASLRLPTLEGAEKDAEKTRILFYKILLNALFGYTIVNSDRHREAQLFDVEEQRKELHKAVSSPKFLGMLRCGDKAVVNKMRASYTLEYPLMLGSAILWESKLMTAKLMFGLYDWFAEKNKTLPKDQQLELYPCYVDTDSIVMSIRNFKHHWDSYDHFAYTFNKEVYPVFDTKLSKPEYQTPETHGELGFMTNETDNIEIKSFVAVSAKCYAYETVEYSLDDEKLAKAQEAENKRAAREDESPKQISKVTVDTCSKAKGISKKLQKSLINYDLYSGVVSGEIFETEGEFSMKDYTTTFNDFRTTRFGIHTVPTTKQYVSLVDLKANYGTNGTEYAIFGSKKAIDRRGE